MDGEWTPLHQAALKSLTKTRKVLAESDDKHVLINQKFCGDTAIDLVKLKIAALAKTQAEVNAELVTMSRSKSPVAAEFAQAKLRNPVLSDDLRKIELKDQRNILQFLQNEKVCLFQEFLDFKQRYPGYGAEYLEYDGVLLPVITTSDAGYLTDKNGNQIKK
jgi:hypothetical protein